MIKLSNQYLCIPLILVALFNSCYASKNVNQTESENIFYIAINGDDDNQGSIDKPFASLTRARDALRQLKKDVAATVIIRGGTYYLSESLTLGPQDSGTKEAPITWRAAKNEKVVLSAGKKIRGKWKTTDHKLWYVELPEVRTQNWNFKQLFTEGKRATRARYPNVSEDNPFIYAKGGSRKHIKIDPKEIKASWGKEADAQINIVPHWLFFNQWNTLKSIDKEKGLIHLKDSELHGVVFKGNWFWIEGLKEELDEPNEWYLDREKARLYYMPPKGLNPNNMNIVASRLNCIIDARGNVENKTHVSYINFSNLEFRHSTFTLGHIEARVHTDAAIRLENAKHCRIENCHVENVGGYAFWLHLDCQHNVINNNTVLNSGGGGVLFTGARFSYMDDTKIYTPGKVAATVFPILNYVTRNTVKHCGQIRYYGGGIHMDSRPASMAMSPGNYIGHNYFSDLSRNGIFAFRNQGGNIVEYNHIHDAMQTTIDGACIHISTMNHLNAPNYILNNWLYDIWGYVQKPNGKPRRVLANGVFLDWSTSNTIVKDNYVYNAGGKPIKVVWGENWDVKQEGNKSSKTKIVPPFVNDLGPTGKASNGINLESNCLTGSVIHYSDRKLVSYKGDWHEERVRGQGGLFNFHLLKVEANKSAAITYSIPITENGDYQISLLYLPHQNNATNAKLNIHHAKGVEQLSWNMKKGSKHGFAVKVGVYSFKKGMPAKVTISNKNADGIVIADSIAFVKVK